MGLIVTSKNNIFTHEFRSLNIAIYQSSHSDCKDEEVMLSKRRIRVVWLNPFLLQCPQMLKVFQLPPVSPICVCNYICIWHNKTLNVDTWLFVVFRHKIPTSKWSVVTMGIQKSKSNAHTHEHTHTHKTVTRISFIFWGYNVNFLASKLHFPAAIWLQKRTRNGEYGRRQRKAGRGVITPPLRRSGRVGMRVRTLSH